MKASWLFTKHPILVDPDLATVIGLNEAIVLQQLNYWLHSKSAKRIDGHLWIYNTYENWQKQNFPFWSIPTIRRTFTSLKKKGIVVTSNFNKAGFDKTKWYSIDETVLNQLMISACDQNDQTMRSKRSDGGDQNDHTYTRDYTENTTEITSSSSENIPSDHTVIDPFKVTANSKEEEEDQINELIESFVYEKQVFMTASQRKQIFKLMCKLSIDKATEVTRTVADYSANDPVAYLISSLRSAG